MRWRNRFSMYPIPPHMHSVSCYQPHSPDWYFFFSFLFLTSESMVCFRVCSWWCTFYSFGQMYNDTFIIIISYRVFFAALKTLSYYCFRYFFSSFISFFSSGILHTYYTFVVVPQSSDVFLSVFPSLFSLLFSF